MLTLNLKAKPKDLEGLANPHYDLSSLPVWTKFCIYSETPSDRYELMTNLRMVWIGLSVPDRRKFSKARDIDHAFTWDDTPQGYDYWMSWNDKLNEIKDNLND